MPLPCIDEGHGPAILFLHGWTMRGAVFAGQVTRLRDRFRCLAPDLPGHGAARDLPPDLTGMARAVEELVAARKVSEVTLVGWSMGAAVGWRWLAGKRAPVRAMLSVEMGPLLANGPGWNLGLRGPLADPAALEADWPTAARAIARAMFAEGAPAELVARAEGWVRDNDPAAMGAAWADLLALDARDDLARLGVPLQAAHGGRSRIYPPATARWVARAAGGGVHRFAGSGHSPHLEEPDAFARLVADMAQAPADSGAAGAG